MSLPPPTSGVGDPRTCTACHTEKPLSEYYTYQRRGDPTPRYHSYCKTCHYQRTRHRVRQPVSESSAASLFEKHLWDYEQMIGASAKRAAARSRAPQGRRVETVVISDLHVPDERMDLLARIAETHRGANLVIAGDLDDFEMLSKFDQLDWTGLTFQESLARRDAVLDFLTQHFTNVEVMLGNHDLRIPRKAARLLGADYAFMSQQFLMWTYEKRHGIRLVTQDVRKQCGRQIPYLHYYHQVGDCMIGHVEVSGRTPGKGAERAHDFFQGWKKELGLSDFRVVLQAHTHKQSYFRHSHSKAHCYEIGALCDIPSYSLMSRQNYGPPQLGYFSLVQYDGVTDINESRLISFE